MAKMTDGISNLVEYAIKDQDPTVSNASIGSFNGITLSFKNWQRIGKCDDQKISERIEICVPQSQ